MTEKTINYTKTYVHFCSKCEKEFDTEQKMNNCPDCKRLFKEVYEHFVYNSRSAWFYYHQCDVCKIQFDSDIKDQICPLCKQPSKDIGMAIREVAPNTFLGKLARRIQKYLS